jgi:hypothetical protein
MAKKQATNSELTAQQLLEARVDAMMDPRPDPKAKPVVPAESATVEAEPDQPGPPPLDIFVETNVNADDNLDDAKSDAAIDDIVAQEGDEVLAAEDAGLASAEAASPELVDAAATKKHHPIFWFIILLLVILAVVSAVALSASS